MLIKQETWITPLEEARTLHLYIPDMLTEGQKVPVLYMFDADPESRIAMQYTGKKCTDLTNFMKG